MVLTEQANKQHSIDYLFVGLGAANSLILLAFEKSGLLKPNNFVVIEPSFESLQNKTFCFWADESELAKHDLHTLINYQWPRLQFSSHASQDIDPYQYYCVEGKTLYQKAKKVIDQLQPLFYTTELTKESIHINQNKIEIEIENNQFVVNKIFDNRPPLYNPPKTNESHLLQSFYGWRIKTDDSKFNTSTAILMDFDIPQQGNCRFVYVLPFSENSALFEVTKFGKTKIGKDEAKLILKDYIKTDKYIIEEEEEGCIPMSSALLQRGQSISKNWIDTGSRANLIKPSTGYAFLKMAEDATSIAEHEKSNAQLIYTREKVISRYRFYDRLLLKIIEQQPDKGKGIFQALFKNIQTKKVLTFLKEKSTIADELKIFSVLPIFLFLKTAFKDVLFSLLRISPVAQTLLLTFLCLILSHFKFEYAIWFLLAFGFFTIGISHGAIDHLTQKDIRNKTDLTKFVVSYVAKGIALGLIWYWQPDIALLAFLIFSAWHFGQADFEAWNLPTGTYSFLWGFIILGLLLVGHYNETLAILEYLPGLVSLENLKTVQPDFILWMQALFYMAGIMLVVLKRKFYILLSLLNLFLLGYLPLLISFGLFFVFQHSQHGFTFLKDQLSLSNKQFFLKAFPFSFAGSLFIVSFTFLVNQPNWGIFFILLSCLSMPHILSMDVFYNVTRLKKIV
jgi:lycopene beta-cyclase